MNMKILFYCDTVFSFGGVQRALAVIAHELSKKYHVAILTTDSRGKMSMYDYDKTHIMFLGMDYPPVCTFQRLVCKTYSFLYKYVLPQTPVTSAIYARSFFPPAHRRKLIGIINEWNYDVVIGVHAYQALHLASIRDRIHVRTAIGWMHNSYEAFFEKEHPYLPRLKNFFKDRMGVLDEIVVLSQDDRNKYESFLGLTTRVIYNPLTLEVKGRADLRHKCFLSVGRFSPLHKGFDLLIKAFALFAQENAEWTLDIVGEGQEEELYRSLIMENKLEDRVRIHPFTKDIHQHYAGSSVYVLASRWEGMPLVLMEAMAYGLPVVASDIPIAKELLDGKGMAVFFEKENINRLADCLRYMATEADLKSMGEKSIAYAENFKIDAIIEQWEKIIN